MSQIVRHPETGHVMTHYEWNGWLWCENEQEAFDFQETPFECPHCGKEVED